MVERVVRYLKWTVKLIMNQYFFNVAQRDLRQKEFQYRQASVVKCSQCLNRTNKSQAEV